MNCKECDIEFTPDHSRKIFCTKSCSAKFNNRDRARKLKLLSNKKCKTCKCFLLNCQKIFCSNLCQGLETKRKTELRILEGKCKDAGTLRRYLHATKEIKCEICKSVEWFGKPMPLVMDHIDGNASNNSLDNLRLICPNCDRFLPTFGSRNRGFGRKSLGIKRGSDL